MCQFRLNFWWVFVHWPSCAKIKYFRLKFLKFQNRVVKTPPTKQEYENRTFKGFLATELVPGCVGVGVAVIVAESVLIIKLLTHSFWCHKLDQLPLHNSNFQFLV